MKRPTFPRDNGSAEEMVREATSALVVVLALVGIIWVLQMVNWADGYRLDRDYGIVPRDVARLPDIVVAPFLHFGWAHIEANSGPLFVFGFLAAFRGVRRFFGVTAVTVVTSGMAVWLFEPGNELVLGASGVVYGYFGYVVVKGLFDRRLLDVLVGLVMALSFAYILVAVVPGTPGVSWTAHLAGLVGGVASGWLFRDTSGRSAPGSPDPAGSAGT